MENENKQPVQALPEDTPTGVPSSSKPRSKLKLGLVALLIFFFAGIAATYFIGLKHTNQIAQVSPSPAGQTMQPTVTSVAMNLVDRCATFSYTIPQGWEKEEKGYACALLKSPDYVLGANGVTISSGALITLAARNNYDNRTLDEDAERIKNEHGHTIEKTSLAGLPAITYHFATPVGAGFFDRYIVIKDGIYYEFSFLYAGTTKEAVAANKANYAPQINSFLQSISFPNLK